ncbi:MAG: hypothetical protein WAW06_00715 [bacterium]
MGALDASGKKASLRFTCQASKTLSAFRIYIHSNESGSKTHRYGIQVDAAGLPSGAWLAYRDLTVSGGSGWLTVTLTSGIPLTADQVYHIVVQPVDSPNKTIALRATSPLNRMIVYDQTPDPNSNTLFYNGSAWTVQDYQPVYLLAFSDNSYEGNPCSSASYGSIYGSIWESERFTLAGADRTIVEVSVFLRREGTPPNDCSFALYDNTDSVEVASGVIAEASEVTTSYAWYTYRLAGPETLTAGKQYRFYLKTTGGNSTNRYQWCMPYNYDAAPYNSRNYDGQGSINETSGDAGASWLDGWPNYDAVFRFTIYSLAITVDPASVALGTIAPGTADVVSQSARPDGELVVTNSGSEQLRYQLGLENPPGWTAVDGPPAGPNQYRLSALFHPDQAEGGDFDKAGPGFADVIGTATKTCDGAVFATGATQDGYDVSPDGTQNLYFSFDAPPSTGVASEQAITITITAQPMP